MSMHDYCTKTFSYCWHDYMFDAVSRLQSSAYSAVKVPESESLALVVVDAKGAADKARVELEEAAEE